MDAIGLTDDDREVANLLRKTKKPILLVVNKVDHVRHERQRSMSSTSWGWATRLPSAPRTCWGWATCWQAICEIAARLQTRTRWTRTEHILQLAVVGRPNVGKSLACQSAARQRTHDGHPTLPARPATRLTPLFTVRRHAVQHHRHRGHPPQARRRGRDAGALQRAAVDCRHPTAAMWRCC